MLLAAVGVPFDLSNDEEVEALLVHRHGGLGSPGIFGGRGNVVVDDCDLHAPLGDCYPGVRQPPGGRFNKEDIFNLSFNMKKGLSGGRYSKKLKN